MIFDKTILKKIKEKNRKLSYCTELHLYKRIRTFNGIIHLHKWLPFTETLTSMDKPLKCLEIGTHEGQSAMFINKKILLHEDSSLLCCDPFIKSHWLNLRPTGLCYEDLWDYNHSNNKKITKYRGKNSDLYKEDFFQNLSFDIIYIDDDHTSKNTKLNIENLVDKLNPGGLLIFDDYDYTKAILYADSAENYCTPVKTMVDELVKLPIIYKDYQIIFRKPLI